MNPIPESTAPSGPPGTRESHSVVVVGAGPAGLTAAAELVENGRAVTVLEKDPEYVGGIARTVRYKNYRFDIGGHRFFSKNEEVTQWWRKRLPGAFIKVPRFSRIYYRGKFFDYPLKAKNALFGLGFFTCVSCVLSYAWRKLFPIKPEKSFADWVTNRFGDKLFSIFFKTYTEKVWGMSCNDLSADWAAQRIKGLSLTSAIWNALMPAKKKAGEALIKTLIDEFEYPRFGPGMMWEQTAADIQTLGGELHHGLRREENRGTEPASRRSRRRTPPAPRSFGRRTHSLSPCRCASACSPSIRRCRSPRGPRPPPAIS